MRAGLPVAAAFGVACQVVLVRSDFAQPLMVGASAVAVMVAAGTVWVLARRAAGAAGRERLAWGLVAAGSVLWLAGTALSLATAARGDHRPPPQPDAIVGGLFTTIIAVAVCVQICTTAVSLVLLSRHRADGVTAFTMLAAAFGVFGITTVVYCSFVLRGVSGQIASVSALMTVGTYLLLRMGRHPMPTDVPPWSGVATGLRAGLPYLPVLCAFPVAVTCWFTGAFDGVLFAAMSVLFLLVLLRQLLALYGISRLLAEVDEARTELQYQATHDHLTGLTNRKYLYERAGGWGGAGHPVALLLIDLDGFKQINDRFGHAVGDEVLVEVADVMTSVVPDPHTTSRLGGDEFAVVLEPSPPKAEAAAVGERIVALISAAGRVGASVGLAYEPNGRATLGSMLSDADAALYRAKAAGKGRVVVHAPLTVT